MRRLVRDGISSEWYRRHSADAVPLGPEVLTLAGSVDVRICSGTIETYAAGRLWWRWQVHSWRRPYAEDSSPASPLFGALIAITPVPASAAADGVQNSVPAVTHDEISARRYYYRVLSAVSLLPAVSLLLSAALLPAVSLLLLLSRSRHSDKARREAGLFVCVAHRMLPVAPCNDRCNWTRFGAFGIKRRATTSKESGYEETLLGFRGFGLRRFAGHVDAGESRPRLDGANSARRTQRRLGATSLARPSSLAGPSSLAWAPLGLSPPLLGTAIPLLGSALPLLGPALLLGPASSVVGPALLLGSAHPGLLGPASLLAPAILVVIPPFNQGNGPAARGPFVSWRGEV